VLSIQALLCLLAVVGWGRRLARTGDDLAQWLALGFTLQLFAALHLVSTRRMGRPMSQREIFFASLLSG
jgi:hypothetical protein